MSATISPDASAKGLTGTEVDPLRYDGAAHDRREVSGILHAMMPSGVRVLDVGCGTGQITLIANRDRGNEVIGVEPDPNRVDLARTRGLTVHTGMLGDELQGELGKFDVVMASDVIEHVAAPDLFLATIKRSMKPGALLLLSLPNVAHWSMRWMLLRGRFDYRDTGLMDATHLRWFTTSSLKQLLEASGFDIVEVRHAAGTWMDVYMRGPFRLLPGKLRRVVPILGVTMLPNLFGVQHVVKARLREAL